MLELDYGDKNKKFSRKEKRMSLNSDPRTAISVGVSRWRYHYKLIQVFRFCKTSL